MNTLFCLDPLFAEHPAILSFLASWSKMQRMLQQKLSCILASVKVSLSPAFAVPFPNTFSLSLSHSRSLLHSLSGSRPLSLALHQLCGTLCWVVAVGVTHVQWLLINPNTRWEIIKCVFTCCAWLSRRNTTTERTAAHTKYVLPSVGKTCINKVHSFNYTGTLSVKYEWRKNGHSPM